MILALLSKVLYYAPVVPHTPVWQWVLGLVVMTMGAAIAIPLWRYADRDDAPGGMVIAFLIFVGAAGLATWIVNPRSRKPGAN